MICFCSPENLIPLKLYFGSERDLEDALVVLLAQKGNIDLDYLENLCRRLDVFGKLEKLKIMAKM
jgi:hypothetical protein